jgi:predicted Zn-dependent protease
MRLLKSHFEGVCWFRQLNVEFWVMKNYLRRGTIIIIGLAAFVLVQGCTTVPVTGRKGINLVSSEQEMQLGLSSFDQLKKETPISRDPAINALVQKVGKQIARVADKDMPNAQWEFVVFESKEANAFCLPGGKVGIYTGILPITKTEAGLATVMGHEVAHAVAHHGAERMSHAMLMQTGQQVLGTTLSTADPRYQSAAMLAYGLGSKVGIELPFDRKQESEADRIGLVYMARAGYDPKEAIGFWQRFSEYNKQQGGGGTPAFLRTHPVDEVRIRQLQEWLPEAQAAFVKSPLQ